MADSPTYAYGENGEVAAFDGDHVIAKGTDFSKVATTATEYFDELRKKREEKTATEARTSATHIITPNGAKGTILGRTATWSGDQVTVRFENGQIRHFDTFAGDGLRYATEQADAPQTPIEYFQRQLDEVTSGSRESLTERLNALDGIKIEASRLAAAAPVGDAEQLHNIVLQAGHEEREVKEALAYLEEVDDRIEPPKMAYHAVEQAELGRAKDDSWLDITAKQMIAETEHQDFDKLLNEGPTLFVSALDTSTLAHAATTGELAREFIVSRTAGFQGEGVENYRDQFIAAAEVARKQQLRYNKDEAHKEAAVKEASVADVPDEALFF